MFYKKEYNLYLSKFCYTIANSFIDVFGVVMLYRNGMPIYQILFLYAIRFGIMGVFCPLFITMSSRLGIAMCSLIANVLRIISSYIILNGNNSNIIFFIFVLGLSGALSNPINDAISSKYIKNEDRGKYNSYRNISIILGQTIASCLIGYSVITNNNNVLFIIITLFFILDYIFIKFVDYKPNKNKKNIFKEMFKYILKNKSNYKIIYTFRANHIIERLFIPLYIYLMLGNFKSFVIITIISFTIQIITVFIIGKYTDKNILKSNTIVSIIKTIITSIYLFCKNPLIISVNKTIDDNFTKAYETMFLTSVQNIIKTSKDDYDLLSAVGQMTLCFSEIIVLSILSFISIFIGKNIYLLIFALSIISTIAIKIIIDKENLI